MRHCFSIISVNIVKIHANILNNNNKKIRLLQLNHPLKLQKSVHEFPRFVLRQQNLIRMQNAQKVSVRGLPADLIFHYSSKLIKTI